MADGWIKLHRLLLQWEWYTTPNMVHFWIHCLLSANHSDGVWRGIPVKSGQFISGRKSLSANTGLSEQSIRTCIDRLKSTNELTSQATNEYTIFTIISWEKYQIEEPSNQPANQRATNEQPTSNQRATTNKNDNKNKNDKNDKNNTLSVDFERFWEVYPKKVGKAHALTAWKKAKGKPAIDKVIQAVSIQAESDQWQKNGGQYIPNPATWINQGRWDDKPTEVVDPQSWAGIERKLLQGATSGQDHLAIGRDF